MKRTTSYQPALPIVSIRPRIIILLFIAMTFQARVSNGQAEKAFEAMLVSDSSIPELVALAKTESTFVDKGKSLRFIFKVKKLSLENRLKQAQTAFDALRMRMADSEFQVDAHRKMIEESMQQTQGKPSVFLLSRVSAEQLLIAAQLELQKVTWDLASEMALFENVENAKDITYPKSEVIQRHLIGLESKDLQEELISAERDLANAEELAKNKAISSIEVNKVRQSVSKAKNSLAMHQLRSQLVEAQQLAAKNVQSAEVKMQIKRLTARKEQIEKHIGELFHAMQDLTSREQIFVRIDRNEKSIDGLSKSQDEMQSKIDEIVRLLSALDSVEFAAKKD